MPRGELDALWALMKRADGNVRLPRIIRYIDERFARAPRWIPPLSRLTDVPVLVMWGRRDPVAVFAIAERLAREIPRASMVALDSLGHCPQLEDPGRVAEVLGNFLADVSPV
ncbi:MAG: alpha/beta hydrolase [Deltaproteobacteria bacterium]